jgi:hypothetical protein
MKTFRLRKLPNRATSITTATNLHKSLDLLPHKAKI